MENDCVEEIQCDAVGLQTILDDHLIESLFQPIYDVTRQVILGFEALSRGPKNSKLESPNALFSSAQRFNKLSELELLCREKAIEGFSKLNLPGKLFLNVSPNTLLDPNHPRGETLQLIHQYGLKANQVVIEVTEQDKVDDGFLLLKTIGHYRKLGFNIAIDDLGAGYSGLKQWSELQPDFVKIDRYFIDNCDKSLVKREFLKSIIELAKATRTAVIAEGIERKEELALISKLGINNAQGFLLERPSNRPSIKYPTKLLHNDEPQKQIMLRASVKTIGKLTQETPAVFKTMLCKDVHRLFEKDKKLMSLAVVDENQMPIGLIHRDQLTEVFAAPYGYALYAKKPLISLMDKQPLIVDESTQLDEVSQLITEQDFDIRRHIVITHQTRYLGLVPLRAILKHITEEKIRNAQHANPLTMLPGNVAINEAIEQRLSARQNFMLAYIDLNHFKQFNDLYGYASGDGVIKLLADVISDKCTHFSGFVGHIGGDDFMVVFDNEDAEVICHKIINDFELKSKSYFTSEHVKAGGYWATNREGQQQFVPLLTLSIGLVSPHLESCQNSHQVAALATDAKKEAKRYRNSYLFIANKRCPTMAVVS